MLANKKVDICFGNSLKTVKSSLKFAIALHALQSSTMACMVLLNLYAFKNSNDQVLSFFIAGLCVTLVNLFSKTGHYKSSLSSTGNCLIIADDLGHCVADEPISEEFNDDLFPPGIISQRVYNIQSNLGPEQATPQIRRMAEAPLANMIRTLALSRDPFNRCIQSLAGGISFALFIYGVIIMLQQSMKWIQMVVIVLFLISEFIIQLQVFACLIFVALLPLLCIFVCFYACFCKQGEKKAQLPAPTEATISIIQQSDGATCSICFQNIMLQEQVIVLPCSQKHVFHENCIKGWTSMKPTCPICRHDLSS